MHKGQSWCRAAGPLSSHCSHTLFPSLIVSPASRSCRTAELRKMKARLQFKNCTLQTLFTAYEKESLGCLEVPLLMSNVSSCSGVLMCSSFLAYLLFHASSSRPNPKIFSSAPPRSKKGCPVHPFCTYTQIASPTQWQNHFNRNLL